MHDISFVQLVFELVGDASDEKYLVDIPIEILFCIIYHSFNCKFSEFCVLY
jgi:hypothetical protein